MEIKSREFRYLLIICPLIVMVKDDIIQNITLIIFNIDKK
jgi:hypothetical protein